MIPPELRFDGWIAGAAFSTGDVDERRELATDVIG